MIDPDRLRSAYRRARRDLLAQRDPTGPWTGELSASALSTATATTALTLVDRHSTSGSHEQLVARGLDWLARQVNSDGGWGDTDRSLSNVATTMLVRAALVLGGQGESRRDLLTRAQRYIETQGGIAALRQRYGTDKTFAVPILTQGALAGLVPWSEVSPLRFELACLPRAMLRFLRLGVVSYALPALVAIGQARFFHAPPRNPLTRLVRRLALPRSLRVLERMQPESGGFLEAVPLTSFVLMSLATTGRADHSVARRGAAFLANSARPDGSWPIDTNLATWNTTLAVNALGDEPLEDSDRLVDWLLACQHRQVHPLSAAAPGGWGWTDLGGAVPDVDDTSGALLALAVLARRPQDIGLGATAGLSDSAEDTADQVASAVAAGVRWLLGVQNADGGWPTFCRGWGRLPFDRSGTDLTAHALRALAVHRAVAPRTIDRAVARGFVYLAQRQRADGAWVPLWFGNEHDPAEENPVVGTARVLAAYRDLGRLESEPARCGLRWLAAGRNADGGWGGDLAGLSGVEETALAVEALLGARPDPLLQTLIAEGLSWLVEAVGAGRHHQASPIGLYFARLWYHEAIYPLAFTVSALRRASEQCATPANTSS